MEEISRRIENGTLDLGVSDHTVLAQLSKELSFTTATAQQVMESAKQAETRAAQSELVSSDALERAQSAVIGQTGLGNSVTMVESDIAGLTQLFSQFLDQLADGTSPYATNLGHPVHQLHVAA